MTNLKTTIRKRAMSFLLPISQKFRPLSLDSIADDLFIWLSQKDIVFINLHLKIMIDGSEWVFNTIENGRIKQTQLYQKRIDDPCGDYRGS